MESVGDYTSGKLNVCNQPCNLQLLHRRRFIGADSLVPHLRFRLGKKPSCVYFSGGVAQ